MDTISIIASVVSIILAITAMGMSMFFYTQSKNTESNVNKALEAIKTQTDMLQKLTGRWMDRLTKYVTSPKESDYETHKIFFEIIKELPKEIASQLAFPTPSAQQAQISSQLVPAYCAIYYYAAISNYWAQFSLPKLEDYENYPEWSNFVKTAVDSTCDDFVQMEKLLREVDPAILNSNPLKHLFDIVESQYKRLIVDSTGYYAKQAGGSSQ